MSEEIGEEAPLVPTPAATWQPIPPTIVELPSGNVAAVKRPAVYLMIKQGRVPAKIRDLFEKSSNGETVTPEEGVEAMQYLVTLAFVEPRVSLVAEEGAIHVDDLDDADLEAVLTMFGLSLKV